MGNLRTSIKRNGAGDSTPDARPCELVLPLNGLGMGPLHRAGLGGLASTLDWIRRERQAGRLSANQVPGGDLNQSLPWRIESDSVTLVIGKEDQAEDYLEKLFALAFQLRDGLIFMPGQQGDIPVSQAVLADLQQGLLLTFLQHGQTRVLGIETNTNHDPEEGVTVPFPVTFKPCTEFKHQDLWTSLVEKGKLVTQPVKLDGPISPGSAVRHVAYPDSKVDQPLELALPAFFAMVGTLALSVNRGVGVLLIPEVTDLKEFVRIRPEMTPRTARSLQITNAADAVLQTYLRLMAKNELLNDISTVTFRSTPWAKQQKTRVGTSVIGIRDNPRALDRFERALTHLPSRLMVDQAKNEAKGKGKNKGDNQKDRAYFVDSVVRPHIAENLARGRPWYMDFSRLMTMKDPVDSKKVLRTKVTYEREGLNAMVKDSELFDDVGEKFLVEAVHAAIRGNYGRIREETDSEASKGLSQACKNRMEKFREKLRIDLAGGKTEDHVRFALMDLFSRAKSRNATLQDQWSKILPIVRKNWRLARDLGLLALVSYKGQTRDEDVLDIN